MTFRVIIDHRLGEDLIPAGISRRIFQTLIHERSNLIHIQLNVGQICRLNMFYSVKAFQNTV